MTEAGETFAGRADAGPGAPLRALRSAIGHHRARLRDRGPL